MADHPILILGAGINGVAAARQLLLNGQSVVLVDSQDVASGATAYSSRLIHGGLRYLEFGELKLVRESLHERTRLLQLAPHFVRPLKLFVPSESRCGGWLAAILRLAGRSPPTRPRGAWLVRCGLCLYDWLARWATPDRAARLPRHRAHRVGAPETPLVDPRRYGWLASFFDAQICHPERFVMAMVADTRRLAERQSLRFDLLTYHSADRDGADVMLNPKSSHALGEANPCRLRPRAVVNATGAWVDETLRQMRVDSQPLMGGTKGSHLVTRHPELLQLLAISPEGEQAGIYAEADDGRPVFILPLGNACLIGTTDIVFDEAPGTATATQGECEYLVDLVNRLFPQLHLAPQDIEFHYAGVRPLPACQSGGAPGSITRRHLLHAHDDLPWPMLSLVGGKLTTCRSLAEEVVAWLASRVGFRVAELGRDRELVGAATPAALAETTRTLSEDRGFPSEAAEAAVALVGSVAGEIVHGADARCLAGLPIELIDHVLRTECVTTLSDLVERRLMLLYRSPLRRSELTQLAEHMAVASVIDAADVARQVEQCAQRLKTMYGRCLKP